MRTYDPADGIRYVHLAQEPATRAAQPDEPDGGCRRLPAGYANRSQETRLAGPPERPALVVLPGGAGTSTGSAPGRAGARPGRSGAAASPGTGADGRPGPGRQSGGRVAGVDQPHVGDGVVGVDGQRGALAHGADERLELVGVGRPGAVPLLEPAGRRLDDQPVVEMGLDEVGDRRLAPAPHDPVG